MLQWYALAGKSNRNPEIDTKSGVTDHGIALISCLIGIEQPLFRVMPNIYLMTHGKFATMAKVPNSGIYDRQIN